MDGFDDPGIFFSDNFGGDEGQDENYIHNTQTKKRFKDFLREFHEGMDYKYRDELRRHYNLGQYYIEVDVGDLANFDEELADKLRKTPSELLPLLEEAATEVADEVTRPRPEGESEVQDVQVMLMDDSNPATIRDLKSDQMARLVKIPGIMIAASTIRAKATRITIQCRSCRTFVPNIAVKPGLEGYQLPRKCNTDQAGRPKCPVDPFFIVPEKCKCVDFQTLKLQEAPEAVPNGEMPRHLQLYCDRYLCDRVVPGNRVTIMGIYAIKKSAAVGKRGTRDKVAVGIRNPYLRVVGIRVDMSGPGRSSAGAVTPMEEEEFRRLSAKPDIHEIIAKSIAPSIYGSLDIKKAISCLLFGGSRKRLPDGLTRRGDINVLLLGDPGTAKSQLLKFVENVSPIGVYTSGKGSSAAGLTASVMRDAATRNFVMEGGAMVLADGGVVCIDEFDKMREDDRVAIHEAMEQQTISIAKAGITTTLNSRCAVLAAANSVFGRWDDTKGEEKSKCGPRLSKEAAEKLKNRYVLMRNGARDHERESEKRNAIPITVRQLEAIIRISEAQAKMQLSPFATEAHVDEALRLFQVSTLDAAMSGDLSGTEGFTTAEDMEELGRIEKQLKRRFAIGSQVSEHAIVQDFTRQKYAERAVHKVLSLMVRRGEIQYRMQRKMLYRIK
ncbi:PREDICTED: DNA replication licensing factor mcm5-like [Branchiostoma belcheri]|uniref:DNA replication licensing factor MCM5 n=1 Tax=Branchiostoma belcheri TaxID=7741 RepID=A0A6P5AG97_BRABE|nr:PREDICTED: DNA replication licensing factor mcm5-like [Branchiostoma belcheri]